MRALYLFLFGLMLCGTSTAQKRSPKDQQITSRYYHGSLFAKVNVGSLLDVKSPTLQTGFEYRFNKRLSGEFAVGIPIVAFADDQDTDSTYHRYYKLRAELHFFPKSRFFYIGPDLLFMRKKQSKYGGHVRLKDAHDYNYTYAELEKTVVAFGMKIGKIFPFSEKWNLDASFAIGTRIVDMTINATGLDRRTGLFSTLIIPEKEGTSVGLHMAVGCKLSYTIF